MRHFWLLGVGGIGLFLSSLAGFAPLLISVFEGFFGIVLTIVFLAKLLVWWHDRPKTPKHIWDDPRILD